MKKGYLILETGEVFPGFYVGKNARAMGEAVFNTSMTGYQEIMTDPSYAGQIMVFCYPLIGNYGINRQDSEHGKIEMHGAVFGNLCELPSHFQSIKNVDQWLSQNGVPGLTGVDTRSIVRQIRKNGTVKAAITDSADISLVNWTISAAGGMVRRVSTRKIVTFQGTGDHIVLIDYGYKKSMLSALLQLGCKVSVVPFDSDFATVAALKPDGIMLSNGPGDPLELRTQFGEIKKISSAFPTLGICLGHQLIALSYGASTGKLLFGHRGANHPVKELASGRVRITAQNHSYVVMKDSIDPAVFQITYLNVNDGSVEGLKHSSLPIETVQFHPEAHPGPNDTHSIFTRFIHSIHQSKGEATHAITY